MKEVKKTEKRIAPLVALTGLMCGCCCDRIATKPVALNPGEFAIFFPPDGAHAPGHSSNGERTIRKVVIKVKGE